MIAHNDITGDALKSKSTTDSYRSGWDRIFGKKAEEQEPAAEALGKEKRYIVRVGLDAKYSPETAARLINAEYGTVLRASGQSLLITLRDAPDTLNHLKEATGCAVSEEVLYKRPDARLHVRLYDDPLEDHHD
jgi:hypothetical protein